MKKIFIFVCIIMTNILFCISVSAITDTIYASEMGMFAIKEDDSLWAFNYYDNNVLVTEPKKIMDDVASVSLGYALKEDGSLWRFLDFNYNWDDVKFNIIDPIEVMQNVKYVSTLLGINNTGVAVIKTDNTLWVLNYKDEFIKKMNNVADVAVTPWFYIALKTDGSVWSTGDNSYGQLGNGTYDTSDEVYLLNEGKDDFYKVMENVKNIEVSDAGSFAFSEDDILYRWGSINSMWLGGEILTPTYPMKYADNACGIANMGQGIAFVNKKDGSVWCYGQTSDKEKVFGYDMPCKLEIDNVYDISGHEEGVQQFLILKANGELYSKKWIDNENIEKVTDNIKLPKKNVEFIKKNFIDISDKPEEMQKSIKSLSKAGIIKGISDTEFSPDESINRAETAALLLRMTGKENETAEPMFSDVTADDWYYSAAGVSQKYGILKGYEDNTFRGEEQVSKLQFVSLAARVLREESFKDITEYEDKGSELNSVPDWASGDVQLALNSGLITEEDVRDNLDEGITRGEAAVILYRLYDRI